MRKSLISLCLVSLCALPLAAENTRTLSDTHPASGLEEVVLEAGVGDVAITATGDERIVFEVILKPRRGGIFSSMKRAEREVEEASLDARVVGDTLRLKVESDSDERRFEENWTIQMPARLALELELGVGDIEIRGLAGGVSLEAGVGDGLIEVTSGDISVELGVGDITVRAPAHEYGRVECSGGVGNARISVGGQRIEGDGFVGHSASWSGDGSHRLEVEVGVGDARVSLD